MKDIREKHNRAMKAVAEKKPEMLTVCGGIKEDVERPKPLTVEEIAQARKNAEKNKKTVTTDEPKPGK